MLLKDNPDFIARLDDYLTNKKIRQLDSAQNKKQLRQSNLLLQSRVQGYEDSHNLSSEKNKIWKSMLKIQRDKVASVEQKAKEADT